MEKFSGEEVLHMMMMASQRLCKAAINEMKVEGCSKMEIAKEAYFKNEMYKEFSSEVQALMEQPRGFEVAAGFEDKQVQMPERGTFLSAGYDLRALDGVSIPPRKTAKVSTGLKAYMMGDEVLMIYPRSSMGIKKGVNLANGVAVIDSDYYGNRDNDGHIIICLYNMTDEEKGIEAGERIAQGVFTKYKTCGDLPERIRTGGTGSTGRR